MTRRLLPILLLWLAFGLRTVGLGGQELRGDEAFGYFFSLAPPGTIISRTLELAEPHPVVSYWLQHGWLALAGHSEFALRFTSTWWNVLAVALVLGLARRLALDETTRLGAGTLATISPYLIWHAQDARMYSMSLALTVAATVAAVSWWERPGWRTSAVYVGLALLALHTHYYAAYVIVAHGVAVVMLGMMTKHYRRMLYFALPLAVLLLLFLPWVVSARHILSGYTGNGDSPGLLAATVRAHAVLLTGATTPVGWQWLPALVMLVAAGVGTYVVARLRPVAAVWLVCAWLVPLGLTWLSAQTRPIFDERYLVAVAPPVYLLAGATARPLIWRIRWERVIWGMLIIAMVVGLVRGWTLPVYVKNRGWRELAQRLEQLTAGVDPSSVRIVQNYPDPTLWYYYTGPVPHLVLPPQANDLRAAQAEVAALFAAGTDRIVLIEQPAAAWDADEIAQTALRDAYAPVAETQVASWPVVLYARPPGALAPEDIVFANGVELVGSAVSPTTLPSGGWLDVHLAWRGSADRTGSETVSVQLLDGAGQLVAQQDRLLPPLPAERIVVTDYGILTPESLAPGAYLLTAVLYDPGQAESPRIRRQDGGEFVELATIHIAE